MLTVKELLYIKLVAETQSFSGAAKSAKITQPALSAAIAKVEDKLGGALFYRDSHTVTPTPAGRYIADKSEHLLREFASLSEDFDSLHYRDADTISFGVGVNVADPLLNDAIIAFGRKQKTATPKFQVSYWYELRRALLGGEIDFFIAANHEFVADKELQSEELYVSDIRFYARKGHPLCRKKTLHCTDLINYPVVTYRTLVASKRVRERLTTEEDLRAFEKNFGAGTLHSMHGTLPLIKATNHIAMTERGFYDSEDGSSALQELEVEDFILRLSVKACWRKKYVLSANDRALIDCFKNATTAIRH